MAEYVSEDKVIDRLKEMCAEVGGMSHLAEQIDVSNESVRIILTGKRPPTGKVLKATGYRKVVMYVKDE